MFEKKPVSRQIRSLPFRLKALSAVVLSTALLSSAYGASLGKMNVLSALGQPLQAEIELHSTTREQAENLKIRLASLETFKLADIQYNPVLSAFRFAVAESNGKPVIRVTSTRPVNEPFVDLLLEVEDAGGRLVREYTFILDPVDLHMPQPIQMAAPVASAPAGSPTPAVPVPAPRAQIESLSPAAPSAPPAPVAQQPTPAAPVAQQPSPAAQPQEAKPEPVQARTVVRGDTLSDIARDVAPEGVSLDQMLVALHRANPHAFVDDNMNRLRTGRILTVPEADAVRAVPEGEARRIVVAQARDFNLYKERLASQVAASAPVAGDTARQSDSGRITTQVEELGSQTATAQDRLQLSNSGIADSGGERTTNIPAGAEERIAQEKALAEANARIAELEKNLGAMQRLLELQNQELADRQAQSQATSEPPAAASATPVEQTPAEPELAESTSSETVASAQESASAASNEQVATKAVPVTPVVEKPVVEKPAAPAPAPIPPVVEAPSFLEHMLGHPLLLPLTGVLAALGVVGVVVRRRRKQQDALVRDSFVQGNSLFGSTGGQSVDTNNSVFSTNFSPSASQLDTNEVDPIAEADVYIAYQKDDQAEEILQDALRVQPARHNVRLKLLEIYKRRKDALAFAACAHEMHALTHGRGEEWSQAALMGRELDAENPLYVESNVQAEGSDGRSAEELDLGALLNSTRMPSGDEGSLLTESGGMSYGSEQSQPSDESSISFDLNDSADNGDAGEAAQQNDAGAEISEWNVEHDIEQIKADADPSSISFRTTDAEEEAADESEDTANKPLEFDISDMGFDLNLNSFDEKSAPQENKGPSVAEEKGEDEASFDPLADFLSSSSSDNSADNAFDTKTGAESASSKQAAEEPILDLDMSPLPKPGASPEQDDLGLSMPEGSVSLDDDGQMWDESPEEVSLAQPTIPVPALGPISAETELSTKLDLAVAYREIGDKEGARELLEEVAASGQAEYAARAQDLLEKIA